MIDVLAELENLIQRSAVIKGIETGKPYIMLPNGHTIADMAKFLPEPRRIERKVDTQTVEAFIEYFQRWSQENVSEIYARVNSVDIAAIIDGPQPNAPDAEGEPVLITPSWCTHKLTYTCPLSRQWRAWTGIDRKPMSQIRFAEFLEDHVADVVEPEGTVLLDLATDLQIHRKSAFGSSTRLATGEHSISFTEENTTGTVEIPALLELALPVFENGTPYKVTARFKYRVNETELMIWIEIVDPEKYIEDAFAEVVDKVAEATGHAPLRVTSVSGI